MTGDRVIYVGGCMRSGTTLVQRLLCAAPGASPLAAECQYLTALLNLHATWSAQFDQFLKDYFPDKESFDAFSKQQVGAFLAEVAARFRSASTLVLKNPELTYHFPVLAAWYPSARFVLVLRDPLDTIASIAEVARRHREGGIASPLAGAEDDMARLSALYKGYYAPVVMAHAQFGNRLFILRYEDLVRDRERMLAQLSQFTALDLRGDRLAEPSEAELAYWQDRRDSAYAGAFRSPLWREPLSAGEIGRHAQRLSSTQIGEIKRHCADFARLFHYWQTLLLAMTLLSSLV